MFETEAAKIKREKAILVGVCPGRMRMSTAKEHLAELERLADTAEAEVVERVIQRLPTYNAATLVGKGKLEQIRQLCKIHEAKLVIFDDDLTGSQAKNIEAILTDIKVIDRSSLILDIFALHARTAESRIMVEIAQMEYTMPRLTRMWTHLCRQTGGIGTRGPGETQLETDRRLVQRRISDLKKRLKKIEKARRAQADQRNRLFHIAVAGYTNAGKSTLTNRLTNAGVLVADQLFATLDSTTRKLWLSEKSEVIISDTVGFIRKLPHHLVASFRSTLGVVEEADCIMHVIDSSDEAFEDHMEITSEVLSSLIEDQVPRILAFNKMDLISPERQELLQNKFPEAVFISATEDLGIEHLKETLLEYANVWAKQENVNWEESQNARDW